MAKQNLLLVDDDAKGLRVMEVSLRNAGHSVTTAVNGQEALAKLDLARPALILADTDMPGMDGYELCRRIKSDDRYKDIPFIFLTDQTAIEDKIRGLELGADDYLTKPIYIKEIITRVSIALQKRERNQFERKDKRRFFGSLEDMGMVDLLQTIELGRKSGVLTLERGPHQARLYFSDGQVVDAETGKLRGEDAVYRLLTWEEGNFEIDFKGIDRPNRIHTTTQGLLMEGMRRVDEWGRLLEQLPPIQTIYQVDYSELAERLSELPDEVNTLLRLFDGHRTALQAIDDAQMGDLEALAAISRLYFEGVVYEVAQGRPAEKPTPAQLPGQSSAPRTPEIQAGARLEDWLSDVMTDPAQAHGPESEFHAVSPRRSAPPRPVEAEVQPVALPGPVASPAASRGSSTSPVGALPAQPSGLVDELLNSVANHPAPHDTRPPLAPVALAPESVQADDTEQVRRALSLQLDEPFSGVAAHEPNAGGAGALPMEALGDGTGALPRPVGEEVFFHESTSGDHDPDVPFEEHKDPPVSKAAYITAAFMGLVIIGGGLFWGLRDTVKPIPVQAGLLEQSWHEDTLKARGSAAPAPALDAGFAAVHEAPPPAESVPASEGPRTPESAVAAAVPSQEAVPAADRPPAEPAPAASVNFRKLLDEGLGLHEKRKYREAVEKFERALALAAGNSTVLLAYAQSLMELDRGADALRAAEKCAALDTNNARAWLIIGSVKQDKGDIDGARAAYTRYIKLAPTDKYAEDVRRVIENIQ